MQIVTVSPDDAERQAEKPKPDVAMRLECSRPGRARLLVATSLAIFSLAAGPVFARTAADEGQAADPYEKTNRVFFLVNGALDFLVIRPVSIFYKRATPRPIRTGLRNAFSNMGEPTVIINDLLQGHGKKAIRSFGRLAINSTFGVAGLMDVAAKDGLPHHDNDFGITMARRGVKSGPYVFVPVLGPGTVRDEIGYGINILIDPFTWLNFPYRTDVGWGKTVGRGLDERAAADKNIKTIVSTSTDPYASIRSFFLQNREAQISGGKVDLNSLPAFDESGSNPGENSVRPAVPGGEGTPGPTPNSAGPVQTPQSDAPPAPAPPADMPQSSPPASEPTVAPKPQQHNQAFLIRTWRPEA